MLTMFVVYSEKAKRYQNEKLKTRNNNSPKQGIGINEKY